MSDKKVTFKTKTIPSIKILAIVSCISLFANLYWQTLDDPIFSKYTDQGFKQFFMFHITYPYDLLSYIFFIFIPAIYYSFIRKTIFFEDGISINRGLPFYNNFVSYDDIASYEIIHSKLMIAIKLKKTDEEIVFGVNDEDRVLSIFDKAGISGDLKTKYSIKFSINSLIMFFFIFMGTAVALGQTSLGLSRFLFR